jgi:hypothetical protein
MSIISLLILLLVICVAIWATRALIAAFKIEDPIATVIYVLVVLLLLLYLIQRLGLSNVGLRL